MDLAVLHRTGITLVMLGGRGAPSRLLYWAAAAEAQHLCALGHLQWGVCVCVCVHTRAHTLWLPGSFSVGGYVKALMY